MADSLVLKGVKDVRKHTGTEMRLMRPKRGGDTHSLKKWWSATPGNAVYVTCSVFAVTEGGNTVYLAVDTNEMSTIRIDHVGAFVFNFYSIAQANRAALYTTNWELIEHYVFPKISGGKIMTVTPAGSADRPSAPLPDTSITSATVSLTSGDASPTVGDTATYSVTVVGDATPYTYTWSATGANVTSGGDTATATLEWTADGAGSVTCLVGSTNAQFDGSTATDTLNVTVNTLFSVNLASANVTYVVTQADGEYLIDGVAKDAITASAGQTIHFDLSDASLSGHPFKIYTDSSKTTEVTVGVEQEGTDLLFTPPIAGSFSYQCANHANMGGDITVN